MEGLGGNGANANRFAVLYDYFVDFSVALEVQILMDGTCGVDIGMGRITAPSSL